MSYNKRIHKIMEIMEMKNPNALWEYLFEDMSDTELDERLIALGEYWGQKCRKETADQVCAPDWVEDYKFWY